jgi:hypothetical protein
MIIIFSGAIGRCCGLGGRAWECMQFLSGFQALGHKVFYMEDCGEESWIYNWETEQITKDLEYPASYVRDCLEPLGLKDKWIYRAGDRSEGMSLDDFLQICAIADLLILRANPITLWREEYDWPQCRIFIDVDPGFTQIRLVNGDEDLISTVERCEHLFTIGQRIGMVGCPIPTAGRHWFKTVSPVSLIEWPFAETDPGKYFTSVMDWRGYHDIAYNGVLYGQKDKEFPKFFELPRHTSQPLLIGLLGASPEMLTEYGWEVVPGESASRTPQSYRSFIQGSRAEFGVAKHGYVLMRGGWFSDRSVCYLASGRPVLLQDTGQGDFLPIGDGLLTFRDLLDAINGIETINNEYERHCRAARLLAEQHFSTERVLPLLLERAMN